MEKDKMIIVALAAVILVLIIGLVAVMPNMTKQDTKLGFKCNSTMTEGDYIKIKLTDANGTAIANQTVNVTVLSKGGTADYHTVKTNQKGVGKLKMDKNPGKYNVSVSYGGNDKFNGCNATKKITVEEKVVEAQSTASSGTSSDTYVEREENGFKYGYKDGRYGFWTPTGNFIEDKSRALSGQDPVEPFMRDGDFYSQL